MPDISLCRNQECTRRLTCHRFTASPSNPQYYSIFEQVDGFCPDYWPSKVFPASANKIEILKWINVRRRHGMLGELSKMCRLNQGLVSMYLTKAGQAVLKEQKIDLIIKNFKYLYEKEF